MDWTRITGSEDAVRRLPTWFSGRMVGLHGTFGLLVTTGDLVRCTSIVAVHLSSTGLVLLDVILDSAGVSDGVDLAWRLKHFLGVPIPAATLATINLTHVVAVVEFTAAEFAGRPYQRTQGLSDEIALEIGGGQGRRPAAGHRDPASLTWAGEALVWNVFASRS